MGPVLAVNLVINLALVVLLEPLSLFLVGLLEQDVLLSVLIHVLEQVDASLIFPAPLLLSSIPLLLVLLLGESLEHALLSCLVTLLVLVMSLQLLDLATAGKSLLSFECFNGALTVKSS